jgi:streptogramin lyase
MRRFRIALIIAAGTLVLTVPVPASAAPPAPSAATADSAFPATFALPNGFPPEGIAIGNGPVAYFGSRANGDIFRANLRTGRGEIISKGPGTQSLGLKIDQRGRLFVSGGSAGNARVVDARTGRVLASYQFATGPSFINDVVLTRDAAWFTDSTNPVLYKLPLGRNGALPAADRFVSLPLTGDMVIGPGNNANGIVTTPDRRALIIVQSNTGMLFRVNTRTGVTTTVDLGAENLANGDGLLRLGQTLYAVQNRLNTVAVLKLNKAGTSARLQTRLTDPAFDIPTTVAAINGRLYLPNARFTTPVTPDTTYSVVSIRRG